jgi:hypothetical protein
MGHSLGWDTSVNKVWIATDLWPIIYMSVVTLAAYSVITYVLSWVAAKFRTCKLCMVGKPKAAAAQDICRRELLEGIEPACECLKYPLDGDQSESIAGESVSRECDALYEDLMSRHTVRSVRRTVGPRQCKLHVLESARGGLGALVWPGAHALASFLETAASGPGGEALGAGWLRGRQVLELGAGVGLAGLWAAMHGAHVTLTDVDDDLLDAMRQNVERNAGAIARGGGSATVKRLDWGNVDEIVAVNEAVPEPAKGFSLILGADVCYESSAFAALYTTLLLCSRPPPHGTLALLAVPEEPVELGAVTPRNLGAAFRHLVDQRRRTARRGFQHRGTHAVRQSGEASYVMEFVRCLDDGSSTASASAVE